MRRFAWVACLLLNAAWADAAAPSSAAPAPRPRSAAAPLAGTVAARISADSLRGHLSFLSSDLLEGRGTPSRGQDLAAEYIAAQFRRAGLEPAGDDGYFQSAPMRYAERDPARFALTVRAGAATAQVAAGSVDIAFPGGVELGATPVVVLTLDEALRDASRADGKVLVVTAPRPYGVVGKLAKGLKGKPAAVLVLEASRPHGSGVNGWLLDGEDMNRPTGTLPLVVVHDPAAIAALGQAGATVSLTIPAPATRAVTLRNVAGLLRGSDPRLKDTYVILTSHYDHLGVRNGAVFNGANDDGSGTVSVLEIAAALAAEHPRPRRSILFLTFFGEERGLMGSRYYGAHPLVPVRATVADLNLEQVGRTDDSEGPQVGTASITGFDYSSVVDVLRRAARRTGVKLWKHPVNSDRFFAFSDNQSLADLGVPAHTLCVSFEYPDYHGKDDDWPKVDYANMARIDRMVALGLQMIANDPQAPTWSAGVPLAAPYAEAARRLRGAP